MDKFMRSVIGKKSRIRATLFSYLYGCMMFHRRFFCYSEEHPVPGDRGETQGHFQRGRPCRIVQVSVRVHFCY